MEQRIAAACMASLQEGLGEELPGSELIELTTEEAKQCLARFQFARPNAIVVLHYGFPFRHKRRAQPAIMLAAVKVLLGLACAPP